VALAAAGAQVLANYGRGATEADGVVAEIRKAGGRGDAVAADLAAADGPHKLRNSPAISSAIASISLPLMLGSRNPPPSKIPPSRISIGVRRSMFEPPFSRPATASDPCERKQLSFSSHSSAARFGWKTSTPTSTPSGCAALRCRRWFFRGRHHQLGNGRFRQQSNELSGARCAQSAATLV
jgi:hypothetical protein